MSQPIITCDKLSKRYILGGFRSTGILSYTPPSLRETLSHRMREIGRRLRGERDRKPSERHEFWALKDVSFEVGRGEAIGLVGRNGAGKSTLLKILSRIVEPTSGSARLRGRVASLLEVGTGFHPELTGRENIYLNGTILGMRKAEIDRKFDAIVAFAEIEEFIDTPVKRYSSGMYVRLAFAVAAHLEPEILIVDEVLAVGDYTFQKKCLGKMQDVATGDGRTILFVSHNMGALAQLCNRGILLESGQVTANGPIREVIEAYFRSSSDHRAAQITFPIEPSKPSQFLSAGIYRADGTPAADFGCDEPLVIRIRLEVRRHILALTPVLVLYNPEGVPVLCSDIRDADPSITARLGIGVHRFEIKIPAYLLGPTTYTMTLYCLGHLAEHDVRASCCEFTLRDVTTALPNRPGFLRVMLPWEHQQIPAHEAAEEGAEEPAGARP